MSNREEKIAPLATAHFNTSTDTWPCLANFGSDLEPERQKRDICLGIQNSKGHMSGCGCRMRTAAVVRVRGSLHQIHQLAGQIAGGPSRWTLVTMETPAGPGLLGANYCTISLCSPILRTKKKKKELDIVVWERSYTVWTQAREKKTSKTTGISINAAVVTPCIGSCLHSAEQLSNLLHVWLQGTA